LSTGAGFRGRSPCPALFFTRIFCSTSNNQSKTQQPVRKEDNMKRYQNVTDHVVIDYDNQSKPKKKYAEYIYGEKPVNITIKVDPVIYGRLKTYYTKEGSSKREVASEAIAYWILFMAKEAGDEGLEQARQDWKEKRL
jgi:hypothetical protein